MNGQWIGKYKGSTVGLLVVDLDDLGDHFEGYAYAYDDNPTLPSTYIPIKTKDKANTAQMSLSIFAIDPQSGIATDWDKLSAQFPGITHGKKAEVGIELDGKTLKVTWKTDIDTQGEATIQKSRADDETEYQPLPEVKTWGQFKEFVNALEYRRFIFRGQEEPRRLRTSFHRTGRADLNTFLNIDIKTLHRHLSQRTGHIFNLDIPEQNGAFLNLVQHHGYPTPLLDWTYSPFVSAFFAYRRVTDAEAKAASAEQKVRIFVFDQKEWRRRYIQMARLVGKPHFSIMEFIAIENERMVPQQSISSVTNVDDIEGYINGMETPETRFLRIIDLPLKERPGVVRELTAMGITAGSLFPGLDGSCEELKERFFRL